MELKQKLSVHIDALILRSPVTTLRFKESAVPITACINVGDTNKRRERCHRSQLAEFRCVDNERDASTMADTTNEPAVCIANRTLRNLPFVHLPFSAA